MSLVCLVDSDSKILEQMDQALKPIADDLKCKTLKCLNLKELEKNIKAAELQDQKISLLVVKAEQIKNISDGTLFALKVKHKCKLVLICYDDPENQFHDIENWPVENLIYKPFTSQYIQESVLLALTESDFVKPQYVEYKPKVELEKIRKINISAISDYGFKMSSKSVFKVGKAYKFYNSYFAEKKNKSMWARVLRKDGNQYELIFCAPKPFIISNIRRRIMAAKNRLKSVEWVGKESLEDKYSYTLIIQLSDKKLLAKITDFFERKFPEFSVTDFTTHSFETKKECDLFISDQEHDQLTMSKMFIKHPLLIRIADPYSTREEAEAKLEYENIRIDKNIDRNFLGRIVNCYFPKCKDEDPIVARWVSCDEHTLQTEVHTTTLFSEAGFEFDRDTVLEHGAYQEFAISETDETSIKILKAKVYKNNPNQLANGVYRHQITFFALKEDQIERIHTEIAPQPPAEPLVANTELKKES